MNIEQDMVHFLKNFYFITSKMITPRVLPYTQRSDLIKFIQFSPILDFCPFRLSADLWNILEFSNVQDTHYLTIPRFTLVTGQRRLIHLSLNTEYHCKLYYWRANGVNFTYTGGIVQEIWINHINLSGNITSENIFHHTKSILSQNWRAQCHTNELGWKLVLL